jgi:hypothetical protein
LPPKSSAAKRAPDAASIGAKVGADSGAAAKKIPSNDCSRRKFSVRCAHSSSQFSRSSRIFDCAAQEIGVVGALARGAVLSAIQAADACERSALAVARAARRTHREKRASRERISLQHGKNAQSVFFCARIRGARRASMRAFDASGSASVALLDARVERAAATRRAKKNPRSC